VVSVSILMVICCEPVNPATQSGGSEGVFQKGEPWVLASLVRKVLVWYGIREKFTRRPKQQQFPTRLRAKLTGLPVRSLLRS